MATSTIKNGFVKVLTTTRTENDYVNEEAFGKIHVYNRNGVGIICGNLALTSQLNDNEPHEIGRIDGWKIHNNYNYFMNVPFVGNGTKVLGVQVSPAGVIFIYASASNLPLPTGFYRFTLCAPLL